jgi:hypothetical protein
MNTNKIKNIVAAELSSRISEAKSLTDSALQCLNSGDYLQAAVRLNELEKLKMDNFQLGIMDAATQSA